MIKRFIYLFILILLFNNKINIAQELNAKVNIQSDLMPISIDKRIFSKLQNDLYNLLNNTKWSSNFYAFNEKIDCNFVLNLEQIIDANVFSASLIVQASRPIFNTIYLSSLINITDREVVFYYSENQNIEYNEIKIHTNNPLADNLTSLFSFYANMIIGLDNSSFSLKGGLINFQKAANIVNNAPEHNYINGWNSFKSRINRYWMVETFVNPSYNEIYDIYYNYYRDGLDHYIEDSKKSIKYIYNSLFSLKEISSINTQNLTIAPLFIQGKADELIRIFKNQDIPNKKNFLTIIERVDPSNFIRYQNELN